jgi:transcriptional regulator with GAF, ATPase, and Fis domain
MKTKSKKTQIGRLKAAIEEVKKRMVIAALKRHTELKAAAEYLGTDTTTLHDIMKRHGIRRAVKVVKTVQVTVAK